MGNTVTLRSRGCIPLLLSAAACSAPGPVTSSVAQGDAVVTAEAVSSTPTPQCPAPINRLGYPPSLLEPTKLPQRIAWASLAAKRSDTRVSVVLRYGRSLQHAVKLDGMRAAWLSSNLYQAPDGAKDRWLMNDWSSGLSGALTSPDTSRLCVPEDLYYPHPKGGVVARSGTELQWLRGHTFAIVLPSGAQWLQPGASEGVFEPWEAPSATDSSPPSLTFCDQQPVASSFKLPPGELVRIKRQPVDVSAEVGKSAVLRVTPDAAARLDAVVVAREGDEVHLVWPYRSIVVDGWVNARSISAVLGRVEDPAKKHLTYEEAAALVGRFTPDDDPETRGWVMSKEGKHLFRWPSVSPNRYPPGKGNGLSVLVCVGVFPFVVDSKEYWGFGFSSSWGGPRFDYEVMGAARDGVLPVRLADAGATRPAERIVPLEPLPSWPDEPVRPAIDPRAVLDENVQHYVRVSDLFRCGYHERTRPGMPWQERAALPDGTPVGTAAPIPPTTCADDFDGEHGSEWGFVFP